MKDASPSLKRDKDTSSTKYSMFKKVCYVSVFGLALVFLLSFFSLCFLFLDYMSKVSSDDLSLKCQECVEPILRQMMDEPDVGDEKKTFIAALIPLLSGEEWGRFYFSVFDFVSEVVFRRSKVLPQKQHACNLKELAFWLSSSSNRLHLHELLSDVLMAPDSLVNLVIYRFSVKLYECAELQFLRLLSPPKTVDSSSIDIEIGMEEKQTLYYALGSVMRNFVVKGKKCDVSASVSARRRCVMERFLFKDESVYSEEFLKIKLWFDKLDRGGLIAADENVFNFVVDLELIIRNCFHDQVLDNESVLNKIFEASHCHMLSFWNDVTQGIMVESDALLFLDTFVRRFISFSGRAEAGLRRRKFYGTVQDRPVALRTGLKSNPKKKK